MKRGQNNYTNKGTPLAVNNKYLDKNDDGKPISSDVLVKEVGESWDKSLVMIFPMTSDILGNRSVGDLELGIGNYLIEKNVPIIDFYSHNN